MRSYHNIACHTHARPAFAEYNIYGCINHVLMSQQKAMKPESIIHELLRQDSQRKLLKFRYLSLLASVSCAIPFLIVSRWRIVFFEIEPSL